MAEPSFSPGDRVLVPVLLRLRTRPPLVVHLPVQVASCGMRGKVLVRSLEFRVRTRRGMVRESWLVPSSRCISSGTGDNTDI